MPGSNLWLHISTAITFSKCLGRRDDSSHSAEGGFVSISLLCFIFSLYKDVSEVEIDLHTAGGPILSSAHQSMSDENTGNSRKLPVKWERLT